MKIILFINVAVQICLNSPNNAMRLMLRYIGFDNTVFI